MAIKKNLNDYERGYLAALQMVDVELGDMIERRHSRFWDEVRRQETSFIRGSIYALRTLRVTLLHSVDGGEGEIWEEVLGESNNE
jgi:hypothetical protein